MKMHSQRGVALIVTLIMLSLVTFMAVAFLAVSRRERASVQVTQSLFDAKVAAETAKQSAMAEVVAHIMETGDMWNYDLKVSTNYYTPAFTSGSSNPLNVNYDQAALNPNDILINLNNLQYSPRPPVYVVTNIPGGGQGVDFRFYYDLNRDGRYQSNGWVTLQDSFGVDLVPPQMSLLVGDPEWIGILENPSQPHGPNNRFIARYCYVVLPAGKSLDLNYIHNHAKTNAALVASDGFLRNQGVGSWEINLAGFLADLATNVWVSNYGYNISSGASSLGRAYTVASSLLNYRYFGNYNNLDTFANLYGAAVFQVATNGYDLYTDGPVMTTSSSLSFYNATDTATQPWPGADVASNVTQYKYYDIHELFISPATRTNNLAFNADLVGTLNTNRDTYSQYTYHRLLSQLGVDSRPPRGKINLNYQPYYAYVNSKQVTTVGAVNVATLTTTLTHGYGVGDVVCLYGVDALLDGVQVITAIPTAASFSFITTAPVMTLVATTQLGFARKQNLDVSPNGTTKFIGWLPVDFFTTVAGRMLQASITTNFVTAPVPGTNYLMGTNQLSLNSLATPNLAITNISIYPVSEYLPEVHRILQVAANMYDATTNNTAGALLTGPYFPSVFRPTFGVSVSPAVTNIYISGFVEETNSTWLSYTNLDLNNPTHFNQLVTNGTYVVGGSNCFFQQHSLLRGQPVIIGAKAGYPNFNEFDMQAIVTATRKLEFVRTNLAGPIIQTNQMIIIGVSNFFGVEAWNSYNSSFQRALQIRVTDNFVSIMTNEFGLLLSNAFQINYTTNLPAGTWPASSMAASFQLPLYTNFALLPPSAYSTAYPPAGPYTTNGGFVRANLNTFDRTNGFPVPTLGMVVSNWLTYALIDTSVAPARVVDFVNLTNLNGSIDISSLLNSQPNRQSTNLTRGSFWDTNRVGATVFDPTVGITNQINVSLNTNQAILANWRQWSVDTPIAREVDKFRAFLGNPAFPSTFTNRALRMQAPFSPTRKIALNLSWEVNDPLVHYTTRDLTDPVFSVSTNSTVELPLVAFQIPPPGTFGLTNRVYRPWGGNPNSSVPDQEAFALWLKDPGVFGSDSWDFPGQKFANIGWLGRVHRGTPWQTIYLKSSAANVTNWTRWSHSGDTHPTNDWKFVDLFTTAPNDNASRSQLSINQTNLAAWSAVLTGVQLLNNTSISPTPTFSSVTIDPAGVNGNLLNVYNGITRQRALTTNFHRLGDILATPELTVISPYLNLGLNAGVNTLNWEQKYGINDAAYERIPQQILSLLTLEQYPRVVVYAYGQALRPADRSIYLTPGPFRGMCTNYSITGEFATRTLVRFENMPVPGQATSAVPPRAVIENFKILTSD